MSCKDGVLHISPATSNATEPFVSDSPLTDPQLDRFRRASFAARIANTLAQRRDPTSTVVLVNGKWGEGKTTLLQYVHGRLLEFTDVVPIWFNPWRFSDETALLLSFFATLASALDKSFKTKKEKLGDLLRDYGAVVGEIALEGYGMKLSAGKAISKLGEQLSTVGLEEKRKEIADILGESGKRVIVFLDDIDRLDRIDARAIFKLLKLTANFEHVSYLLAFDRDDVAASIGKHFGEGDKQAGYAYLEKIVQVNLELPVADQDAMAELCFGAVDDALRIASVELTPEQIQEFQFVFLQHIVPELVTPRLAKLYANAVAFVLPLLAREVNTVDLLVLEAVKLLYPWLHQDVRASPQIYTGEFGLNVSLLGDRDQRSKEHICHLLENALGSDKKRVQTLLTKLFPQLEKLFRLGEYGGRDEERNQREQRVSSVDYLRRYLTCSIPSGDVSDQEVDRFLRSIAASSEGDVVEWYLRLIGPDEQIWKQFKVFHKIRRRAEDISAESAETLAIVVAKHGSEIREIKDALLQPISGGAALVAHLISRVDQTRRYDVAVRVLTAAEPIFFAVVCLDWMRQSREDSGKENVILSPSDLKLLQEVVANKIASHASGTSIISDSAERTGRLLRTWQEGQGSPAVKNYVKRVLQGNSTAVSQFIRPFLSYGGRGQRGLDQDGYDFALKYVDAEVLMDALNYSGLLDTSRTDNIARIAREFAAFYLASESLKQERASKRVDSEAESQRS